MQCISSTHARYNHQAEHPKMALSRPIRKSLLFLERLSGIISHNSELIDSLCYLFRKPYKKTQTAFEQFTQTAQVTRVGWFLWKEPARFQSTGCYFALHFTRYSFCTVSVGRLSHIILGSGYGMNKS